MVVVTNVLLFTNSSSLNLLSLFSFFNNNNVNNYILQISSQLNRNEWLECVLCAMCMRACTFCRLTMTRCFHLNRSKIFCQYNLFVLQITPYNTISIYENLILKRINEYEDFYIGFSLIHERENRVKKVCFYYNEDKINDGNHCDNSLYCMDIVLHTNSLAFKRQNSRNYLKWK